MTATKAASLLTPDEVADQLRITRAQVQELARRKDIAALKIGRYWRFEQRAVDRYLEKARVAS